MLIDWFTVGAQAVNFLILVWLMKHFLHQPILRAIDAREERIAAELADAAAQQAEARQERETFEQKNTEFDSKRAELLKQATDEARSEQQRLLQQARKAADILGSKRRETLEHEAALLGDSLLRRTHQEVFAIARKTLSDLAGTGLEDRMAEVFAQRLRAMTDPAKGILGTALKAGTAPALVRSAFTLPADQRSSIQTAVNEAFSADIHLRFETAPDLISGIELSANGQKTAWNIAGYLASMETAIADLLGKPITPEPKAAPAAEGAPEPAPAGS